MASIQLNPMVTTNAAGSFNIQSEGYVVGSLMPDPAVRFQLAGGVLNTTETLPIWGGVGISESVDAPGGVGAQQLGPTIIRATTLVSGSAGQLTGFTVFDQAHAWFQTPQSPVPNTSGGGLVNFVRLGSLSRIALNVSPALVAAIPGGLSTQLVTWDFVGQQLVPVETSFSAATISGAAYSNVAFTSTQITAASWASTSGGQATFTTSANLSGSLSAGNFVNVSGVLPGNYNGVWPVVSTTATTVTVSIPSTSNPGLLIQAGTMAQAGGVVAFTVGSNLTTNLTYGDDVIVASVSPVGYNGTWPVLTVTATVVTVLASSLLATPGTYASGGTLAADNAGNALPVKILDYSIGGSIAPVYNPATGFVTWNRNANAALVLI